MIYNRYSCELLGGVLVLENKDSSNIGEEIKDIIQGAVGSMDFHKINRDISKTVDGALKEVNRALNKDYTNPLNNRNYVNRTDELKRDLRTSNQKKQSDAALNKPVGKVSSVLFTVFGSIGLAAFGIPVFVLSILSSVFVQNGVFGYVAFGLLPFLIGSVVMLRGGVGIGRRLKRSKRYLAIMNGRNYCDINELSYHIGKSEKFVVRDLRKMIMLGMYPQGHIDKQRTCFMLDNESYAQYLETQKNMLSRQDMLSNQNKTSEHTIDQSELNHEDGELKKALTEGKDYILQIREANQEIPGEVVSAKLDRMEDVIKKIFAYVEQHPNQLSEIKKFMEYYLPTTVKLLRAYKELDNQPIKGENISTAKGEIEDTLDTINIAYEKLLDSLFEDIALDISTDISVLATMLAQEGLREKDFK